MLGSGEPWRMEEGEECFEGVNLRMRVQRQAKLKREVTFFFGYGQGSKARGYSGTIGCLADVLSSMLREGIDYDQGGGVCRFIEMKDSVGRGFNWLLVVEPADLWLWHAGHTSMKPGHLPMRHTAACYWVDERGFLSQRGSL